MRTKYFILEASPDELAGAVDVDALAETVVRARGRRAWPASWFGAKDRTGPDYDPAVVLSPLLTWPARIKVLSLAEINRLAKEMGVTTGCSGGDLAWGLCPSWSFVAVIRLDWPGLVAHELCHLVQKLLRLPVDEREARRVEERLG